MKRLLLAATLLLATWMALVACGSDDNDDGDATGSPTVARTSSSSATGTPGGGTPVSGTPGAGPTTGIATPAATLSPEEATRVAGNITGGDPNASPVVVSTIPVPTPAPGVTPIVDPTQIASPEVTASGIEYIVDMDASKAGVQASRDLNAGDTFRVAIIATNIPPVANNIGGLAAFNFILNYDKTKIVAPTIAGGPATERNPDLNLPDVGGDVPQWDCLPAPEGDMDDPGGIAGDGNPATGQALLSCFAFTPQSGVASGTVTLAVVTFTAIGSGSSELRLSNVEAGDAIGTSHGHCEGDGTGEPYRPCRAGTANVR